MAQGGKIKNWSRIETYDDNKQWTHDEKRKSVDIQYNARTDNYHVLLFENGKWKKPIQRNIKTKKQAEKIAVRWMRAHPRG